MSEVYQLDNSSGMTVKLNLWKFYYQNTGDTAFNSIVSYKFNSGIASLYDNLELTTINEPSRAYKQLWFFPFITNLYYILGIKDGTYSPILLPILVETTTTNCDLYLPMLSKCFITYQIHNNWGIYNFTDHQYVNAFYPDSTRWFVKLITPVESMDHAVYNMKKVKNK